MACRFFFLHFVVGVFCLILCDISLSYIKTYLSIKFDQIDRIEQHFSQVVLSSDVQQHFMFSYLARPEDLSITIDLRPLVTISSISSNFSGIFPPFFSSRMARCMLRVVLLMMFHRMCRVSSASCPQLGRLLISHVTGEWKILISSVKRCAYFCDQRRWMKIDVERFVDAVNAINEAVKQPEAHLLFQTQQPFMRLMNLFDE